MGDTIVRAKTLVARTRRTDGFRRQVLEAEREQKRAEERERRRVEAARKRQQAIRERRRVTAMFLVLLLLVLLIFVMDTMGATPDAPAETAELPEAQEEPESPAASATEQEAVSNGGDSPPAEQKSGRAASFPDTLAEYHSDGIGTENRFNNLRVACEKIDGYVLEAGEQFSFNDTVGERTKERGFLEASVYTTDDNGLEVGGGICQVASTLYECALGCDLQIDERSAHMYTVEYVPYGLDATVYWGYIDLKFTNNSGAPIQIQAEASDSGVTVRMLGKKTSDKRIALSSEIVNTYEFDVKKNVDYTKDVGYSEWETMPKNGYDVFSYQDIYSADGELLEHRLVTASYYQKIDLILRVGPDT